MDLQRFAKYCDSINSVEFRQKSSKTISAICNLIFVAAPVRKLRRCRCLASVECSRCQCWLVLTPVISVFSVDTSQSEWRKSVTAGSAWVMRLHRYSATATDQDRTAANSQCLVGSVCCLQQPAREFSLDHHPSTP